ncbi:MAG: LamG domain-containing protein [Promethearchaeota archaeon]
MKGKTNLKNKISTLLLLLTLLMTSYYALNFTRNSINDNTASKTKDKDDMDLDSIKEPNLSILGEAAWWSDSFYYRRLINITNPETEAFTNFVTSIAFDYSELVSEGKMQSDLDDIRIVQNDQLMKYFVKKDFNNTKPQINVATVYFLTNISGSEELTDTYLYYGNSTCGKALNYYMNTNFGLISRWDLEDGPGSSTAKDSIKSNDGTLTNMDPNTDWVNGEINDYALDFDGYNDYVRINDNPSLTVTTGLTISFWANRQTSDNWELVIGNGGGWSENGYQVMGSSTRLYRFEIQNRTGTIHKEILDTATQVPNNQWHMITATFDGDYMAFYIDDNEDIRANVASLYSEGRDDVHYIGDSSNQLRIGYHTYGPSYFDGRLDDLRIYNYALTDTEVEWLYNKYELETKLNEEQGKRASVKVYAKDRDGNPVINAIINLVNKSLMDPIIDSKITSSEGSVTFEDLEIGDYNFSVYLESNMIEDYTILVNETSEAYSLQGLYREIELECNVGTNIFQITDIDGLPLESGWVEVGNITDGFGQIQKCEINETGNAVFQWLYDEYSYNYTVFYEDINYNPMIAELANGTLENPGELELIEVKFTTVNFIVKTLDGLQTVSGAKISLNKRDHPGVSIVNLTTDENGKATLRWFNSSGLDSGEIVNYSMKLYFFGQEKIFNITNDLLTLVTEFNFTVSSASNYEFRFSVTLTDFTTEITPLVPDSMDVLWGSELTIRALFNVTKAGDPNVYPIGPDYADSMRYTIGSILSGPMTKEENNKGRHIATIDTHYLEGGKGYTIIITAQKSGFTLPLPKTISLTVLKNEVLLNQSQNDDSPQEVYWQETATMSVKPYGEISESFIIQDNIFVEPSGNNYYFDFSVPDLSTDWNLSKVIFNLYNVRHYEEKDDIWLKILGPGGFEKTWDNDNTSNYYYYSADATNGTWVDLLVEPTFDFNTIDNNFNFIIQGTFEGSVQVVAEALFTRNKITVEYDKFNVTDAINVPYDGNGWAIEDITFELTNCFDPITWNPVNPADVIRNITIEGYVFDYFYDVGVGYGKFNINNTVLYPIDNQFSFVIGNISDIIFDVAIKVNYIQGFYFNNYLEEFTITMTQPSYDENDPFIISPDEFNWNDQGATLIVSDINNGTDYFSPSEVGMNITLGTTTYYFGEYGTLDLALFPMYTKNTTLSAILRANREIKFTLSYKISYLRTVYYEITGTVSYEVEDMNGNVPYIESLDCYQIVIDTDSLNALRIPYDVVFTFSKNNYEPGTKTLDLFVDERLTLIDGSSINQALYPSIYIKDAINFTFSYTDAEYPTIPLLDLDTQSYDMTITSGGQSVPYSTGNLYSDSNNNYVLDVDTETLKVGTYTIWVTLYKQNYELKQVIIFLTVNFREIDYELGDMFENDLVSVVKGKTVTLEIKLTDPTQGDIPLKGAKVVLEIGNDKYEFEEVEDGVYELKFDTKKYEAFYTSNTLTGTIKISKEDYISEEVDITIVVEMEEVVDGVPTFYFLMIVGALAAIFGSLATYKYIQIIRIPKFVKKARKFKKAIKSKEEVSESLLYPSKEEFMVRELQEKYDNIGVSISELLGVKPKKGKILSDKIDSIKKKGGNA